MEGDRISSLEGHRQLLEQIACLPGIFSDGCDTSAYWAIVIIIFFQSFYTLGSKNNG